MTPTRITLSDGSTRKYVGTRLDRNLQPGDVILAVDNTEWREVPYYFEVTAVATFPRKQRGWRVWPYSCNVYARLVGTRETRPRCVFNRGETFYGDATSTSHVYRQIGGAR